jgi:hypothetical protein
MEGGRNGLFAGSRPRQSQGSPVKAEGHVGRSYGAGRRVEKQTYPARGAPDARPQSLTATFRRTLVFTPGRGLTQEEGVCRPSLIRRGSTEY